MQYNLEYAPIRESAKQAMYSTALEFSEDIVRDTDPLLIEIFQRIERGESTHQQEIEKLFSKYHQNGTVL